MTSTRATADGARSTLAVDDDGPGPIAADDAAGSRIADSGAGGRYPGGKNAPGVFQRIINLIPPHRVYIEPFAGSGAVLLRKKPARSSIAVEIDADVARSLASAAAAVLPAKAFTVINGDGIRYLAEYAWRGDEFVYCDPPYIASSRRGGRIYRHELSDKRHLDLLSVLAAVPAGVMLSGYRSPLYDRELRQWRRVDYRAMTRGGPAVESLWLNYDPPALLHDDRYLGDTYRERERIKRKRQRWVRRFASMPALERASLFAALRSSLQ